MWSSNWWDVISFGWNDAYGIALDYRAFRCAADLERRLGRAEKAEIYRKRADRIKAVYYSTFYNPKTGVLAGWRSKDGQLHDYYFTFVNGIAVAYGLVTPQQGNAIMDRMQAKMREVGYKNFRIGLPGNLIPVARKDYAGGVGMLGSPRRTTAPTRSRSTKTAGRRPISPTSTFRRCTRWAARPRRTPSSTPCWKAIATASFKMALVRASTGSDGTALPAATRGFLPTATTRSPC